MQRRKFVAGAAATTTAMLAGCGFLGGGGGSGGPEGAVEDYYQSVEDRDRDAADDILHSDSPIRPLEDSEEEEETGGEISLQSTEVTDDEPDEDAIRDEMGDTYGQDGLDTLVEIADGADDAAIVEAEVEFTAEVQGEERTETTDAVHLTATEDGDWTVVG